MYEEKKLLLEKMRPNMGKNDSFENAKMLSCVNGSFFVLLRHPFALIRCVHSFCVLRERVSVNKMTGRRESYCAGKLHGYLCVEGVLSKYYECNLPYFSGWRACGTGTQCKIVGLHEANPCEAVIGREGEDGQEQNQTQSSSTYSPPEASTPYKTSSLEDLTWWNWALIGLGLFLLVGVLVSIGIGLALHLREKKRLRKNLSASQIFAIKEMAENGRRNKVEKDVQGNGEHAGSTISTTKILFGVSNRGSQTVSALACGSNEGCDAINTI